MMLMGSIGCCVCCGGPARAQQCAERGGQTTVALSARGVGAPGPAARASPSSLRLCTHFTRALQVVCPGDTVLLLPETGVVRIGSGVQQASGQAGGSCAAPVLATWPAQNGWRLGVWAADWPRLLPPLLTGAVRCARAALRSALLALQDGERLVAVKAGLLQQAPKSGQLWVQGRQKR